MRHIIPCIPAILCLALVSCGANQSSDGKKNMPDVPVLDTADDGTGSTGNHDSHHAAPVIVRGQWIATVTTDSATRANSAVIASVDVVAATSFVVDPANFKPVAGPAVTSFGTLNVSALSDNNLRVCGTSGTQRCTKALIRVYTIETPAAGLWNDADAFGLPILTGTNTIGLAVAGAVVTHQVTVTATQRNVKLANFGTVSIPVSVDFTDASAGTYHTKVVVEYALQ